ncbi:glycosyltransferase family 4 protein [Chloroflexota bacterium]
MRIGIITDPMDTKSSVRIYLCNLIENLFKIHDPKDIYLIHAGRSENPLYRQGNEIIIPGLYRDTFASAPLADVFRPFLLRKYKLDIIHYSHSYAPLTFLAAGAINVCLITTIGPATHPQYYPWPSRYIIKIARLVNRKMDMILTESESEKKEIVKFLRVPEDKVRVIHSGVEDEFRPLDNLNAIKSELLAIYKIEFPYILHLGAYRPVKNGPTLIRAFAEIKKRGIKHKLVLVGQPAQQFEKVLELIKELGLEEEVITTGLAPAEDLPKFYNAADLFVLPSVKESFGHVLVEALACGCPVVTSNVTCMPEIVGDAGVLVDPYDVGSLADGMYIVLTNNELRQNLKEKSLQRAKLFSWEKCARETLSVYEELYQVKAKRAVR